MILGKNFDVRRQGELDGLCGIYSIVHYFLRRLDDQTDATARDLFRRALGALEEIVMPKSEGIHSFYRERRLKFVFNSLADYRQLPVSAVSAKQFSAKSIRSVMSKLEPEEAMLVLIGGPKHWVLAHSHKEGTFRIDDSAVGKCRKVNGENIQGRKFYPDRGLVFKNA